MKTIYPKSSKFFPKETVSDKARSQNKQTFPCRYDDVLPRVLARGLKKSQLDECLREYEELNVWVLNPGKTKVRFIETESED